MLLGMEEANGNRAFSIPYKKLIRPLLYPELSAVPLKKNKNKNPITIEI